LQALFGGNTHDRTTVLAWWREGLLCCLPSSLRRRLAPAAAKWVLEVVGEDVYCYRQQGETRHDLGRHSLSALLAGARLNAACGGRGRLVTLRLPRDWALRKRVHFPAATRENLGRVIGFEMDRLTPFTPDQVLYDYRLVSTASDGAELMVDLVVLPRGRVDPWLGVLASAGIRPSMVEVPGLWPKANLLPQAQRPTRGRREKTLNGILAGALLILLAAALAFPLWQKRRVVVELNERVAKEKRQAEVVLAIRERLDKSEQLLRFAPDRRRAEMPVLDVLNVLTELLPDHTWVQQLEFRGDSVELRGVSQQASALIQLLEASKVFTQVGFRSPVLQNQGQENFHLAAKILGTPLGSGPAATPPQAPAPSDAGAGIPPASPTAPAGGAPAASVPTLNQALVSGV